MIEITTIPDLQTLFTAYPFVIVCVYISDAEQCAALLPVLCDLEVLAPGVAFVKADATLPAVRDLKHILGIAKFPTVLL